MAMPARALGGPMAGGVALRVADWLTVSAAPCLDRGAPAGPPATVRRRAVEVPRPVRRDAIR